MDYLQKIWPNWTIEEKIGEGAYGKVYKIRREESGYVSYAALKVIEFPQNKSEINELMNSGMEYQSIREYYEELKQNLINEIRIMESLKTAGNTVSIEDYCFKSHEDGIGWTIYIRMELLESLNDYLQKNGELSKKELLKLGSDICMALKCCEQSHVIHRDIKPDNIFRNPYGDYKLGDFGISKQLEMTKSAYSQKGTSMYMAPEVFRGEHYDHTVDIYSLGIMLYRLANHGRFPFMPPMPDKIKPSDAENAMRRRMNGEEIVIPQDMDTHLGSVMKKACAYSAKERYQNADSFRNALLNIEDIGISEEKKSVYHAEQNMVREEENEFEKTYGAWENKERKTNSESRQQETNKDSKADSEREKVNSIHKPWLKAYNILEKLEFTNKEDSDMKLVIPKSMVAVHMVVALIVLFGGYTELESFLHINTGKADQTCHLLNAISLGVCAVSAAYTGIKASSMKKKISGIKGVQLLVFGGVITCCAMLISSVIEYVRTQNFLEIIFAVIYVIYFVRTIKKIKNR